MVARGGFGMFYNGFENRGFSPNLGENYPFQFNFQYSAPDDGHPISFPGCAPAATFEVGFSCTPLDPTLVNASGLALRGIQFDYQTPYSMSGNLTLQYQVTPTFTVQAGYVTSLARHLESFPGSNRPTQILPVDAALTGPTACSRLRKAACPSLISGKTRATPSPAETATIIPFRPRRKSNSRMG